MTKEKLKKAGKDAVKIATPIIAAAVLTRFAGGKLDLKATLLDIADAALHQVRTKAAQP